MKATICGHQDGTQLVRFCIQASFFIQHVLTGAVQRTSILSSGGQGRVISLTNICY